MAESKAAEPQRVVVVGDSKAIAREEFRQRMRELKKNPLDRAKRPGGYFIGADGKAHDAHGNAIDLHPDDEALVERVRAERGIGAPAADLEKMTKDELVAIADERGLTVEGQDGGRPTKADYVSALT